MRGNLGEEKQLILIFLAQVSARRYLGCLSAARRTQEENRDYSQSRRMFSAAPNRNLYFHAECYLNQWLEVQRFLHGLERFLVDAFLTNTKSFHKKSLVFIWIIPDKTNALRYRINTDRSIMRVRTFKQSFSEIEVNSGEIVAEYSPTYRARRWISYKPILPEIEENNCD